MTETTPPKDLTPDELVECRKISEELATLIAHQTHAVLFYNMSGGQFTITTEHAQRELARSVERLVRVARGLPTSVIASREN